MIKSFSPASVISVVGACLTVIGLISYFSNAANLSVPTFFYGVPILLIGLALKNSELAPVICKNSPTDLETIKQKMPEELQKLIEDVSRFRYGQRVHLETSLQALKLWDEGKPPQLKEITLLEKANTFGIQLRFKCNGVPQEKWNDKKDRLGRFFSKGLMATIKPDKSGNVEIVLLPSSEPIKTPQKDGMQ